MTTTDLACHGHVHFFLLEHRSVILVEKSFNFNILPNAISMLRAASSLNYLPSIALCMFDYHWSNKKNWRWIVTWWGPCGTSSPALSSKCIISCITRWSQAQNRNIYDKYFWILFWMVSKYRNMLWTVIPAITPENNIVTAGKLSPSQKWPSKVYFQWNIRMGVLVVWGPPIAILNATLASLQISSCTIESPFGGVICWTLKGHTCTVLSTISKGSRTV